MTNLKAWITLGVVSGLAASASAQDSAETSAAQAFELPSHRALQSVINAQDSVPAPFTTDGCSGGLSEIWGVVANTFPKFKETYDQKPPWEGCCVTHDRAYHTAGDAKTAEESYLSRIEADAALQTCVQENGRDQLDLLVAQYDATPEQVIAAYQTIASAMYVAVRFGGAPCSGLPWRWGYGYPQCSIFTGAFE
jgi:hypothetical protein